MANDSELISLDANDIKRRIFIIRGKQVMLDSDLAELYGYEVKNLNRQVKRNARRFPDDFMFKLTRDEVDGLVKCQIVTSRITRMFQGQSGGRRKLPNVFTEQGIYMLATVLKGELAEQQSIFIMRAFISKVELKQLEADKKFDQLFEYIGEHTETNQKLFFDGQIYDAFSLLIELIQKAEQEIILIDGYVDVSTLNLLAKKNSGVAVTIYTLKKTKLTAQDVAVFNAQYPQLNVKYTNVFHDRFLILDGKTVYHIGASLKDAGKKCFGVTLMKDAGPDLMKKLAQQSQRSPSV